MEGDRREQIIMIAIMTIRAVADTEIQSGKVEKPKILTR